MSSLFLLPVDRGYSLYSNYSGYSGYRCYGRDSVGVGVAEEMGACFVFHRQSINVVIWENADCGITLNWKRFGVCNGVAVVGREMVNEC